MAARKPTRRQLTVSMLALLYDLSFKELGAAAGMSQKLVSQSLRPSVRRKDVSERIYQKLLAAIPCPPEAIAILERCLDGLEAQEQSDLTSEENALVEETVLQITRQIREALTEAVRLSRAAPNRGYPEPGEVAPCRHQAETLWSLLKGLSEADRLAVVRVSEEYQTWALCERICQESATEASRDVDCGAGARLRRVAQ